MRRLILSVMLMCVGVGGEAADTPGFSEQAKLACVERIKERTAALVANDWSQLERLAKRYIQSCRGAFDARDLSDAYVHISIATLYLGRPKEALLAADSCIATYYANSGCHLEKVQALLKLNRLSQAKDAFHIADRLASHAVEQNESDLRNAREPSERELYMARKTEYESQLGLIEALRNRYFDK